MIWMGIIIAVILFLLVLFVVLRNKLITAKNLVDSAYADVDSQLLLRFELIPKLVQITQHYATYEAGILEKIAESRDISIWKESDNYPQILSKIRVIKENHPDLKANMTFEDLMIQIKKVEDHLRSSRRFYNGTVEVYNNRVAQFPYSLISFATGHQQQPYISAE